MDGSGSPVYDYAASSQPARAKKRKKPASAAALDQSFPPSPEQQDGSAAAPLSKRARVSGRDAVAEQPDSKQRAARPFWGSGFDVLSDVNSSFAPVSGDASFVFPRTLPCATATQYPLRVSPLLPFVYTNGEGERPSQPAGCVLLFRRVIELDQLPEHLSEYVARMVYLPFFLGWLKNALECRVLSQVALVLRQTVGIDSGSRYMTASLQL